MRLRHLAAAVAVAAASATGASIVSLPQSHAAPFEWRERQNGRYHLVVGLLSDTKPAEGGYYLQNKSVANPLYLQAKQLDKYGRPTPGWIRLTHDNAKTGNYVAAGWSKRWLGFAGIGIRVCEDVPNGKDLCGTQYVAFWRPQGGRGGGGGGGNGGGEGGGRMEWGA